MLQVTTEHQQNWAVLAGGALAELLEGIRRGWQGALQGRSSMLWQCGRGSPGHCRIAPYCRGEDSGLKWHWVQ